MIEKLFEPASIKGIQLRNRFVRSATAEGMTTFDGHPTRELKEIYCKLAEGEVGLIITCGACIEAWQKITHAVHERGTKIAMQIGHLGRQDIHELRGSAPIAPSAIPIKDSDL